jgi:hypothetical protein
LSSSRLKKQCGNCIYYLKPECPRQYSNDTELFRKQEPCENFLTKENRELEEWITLKGRKYAKPSASWYLLPIIFGIIGGLIAYVGTKDENSETAITLLLVGIISNVVVVAWLYNTIL